MSMKTQATKAIAQHTPQTLLISCIALGVTVLAAGGVHAAIADTVTGPTTTDSLPALSSADLLQTNLQSTAISPPAFGGQSGSALYDGSYGNGVTTTFANNTTNTYTSDGTGDLIFVLDSFFQLTEISVWSGYGSNGRTGQYWDVFVSTDGGSSWGSALYSTGDLAELGGGIGYNVNLTGFDPGFVNAIKFTEFSSGGGANVYHEIDVFGSPVPEPASALLLGLAGVLVPRRRRQVA
jgi:hypothetical protein